ncbi:hypothetical protein MXB_2214 [Myxobolus squamalis]|nr:hypothetical protein MXB_2214 [Myxobolus squamalis]
MKRATTKRKGNKKDTSAQDELWIRIIGLNPEDLSKEFEHMLDEMNVTDKEIRESAINRDTETKLNMVYNYQKNEQLTGGSNERKPTDFSKELSKIEQPPETLHATLQSLRIYLGSGSLSRSKEFCLASGEKIKPILIKYIQCVSHQSPFSLEILMECTKCMKSFMDDPDGLKLVMKDPEYISSLVCCLIPEHPRLMVQAIRLLAAISLVNSSLVLTCISQIARKSNTSRFQKVVDGMQPDMPFSLKELKKYENNTLNIHVNFFEESKEQDILEIQNRLQTIEIYFP